MRGGDVLAGALWGLRSRPARTAALVICLAAGVTAAVFVGVVISGFSREIDRLAFGAYSRALVVQENVLLVDRYGAPTLGDLRVLRRDMPEAVGGAAWVSGPVRFHRAGDTHAFRVYGVEGDYRAELDSPVVLGRALTLAETAGIGRNCLVGAEVALVLGGGAALLGRPLRLNGVDCRVVGVLGEPRSRPAAAYADGVIAPFAAAQRYFISEEGRVPGETDRLTLFVRTPEALRPAQIHADRILRKRYGAPQSRGSPFSYGERNASLEQMLQQRRMLSRLLATLAALSILTSLVAFGGLVAASLIARQREIAIRMALGASDRSVQLQMLVENGLIGLAGGLAGVALGVGLGRIASSLWSWPFAVDVLTAGAACGLGLVVGLAAGLWAAGRAVRLPPSLAARG
jgi:putative ABC transport system permease protein